MVKDNPDARNDFLAALKTIKRIEDFAVYSVKNPTATFDEVAAEVGGSPLNCKQKGITSRNIIKTLITTSET